MKKIKTLGMCLVAASALSLGFGGCGSSSDTTVSDKNNDIVSASLTKKWETKADFSVPESVIYDSNKKVIYATNVNSAGSGKVWGNNNSYISKIDSNGIILSKKWATGLKAPKGLALNGEHLYAADNNTIVDINTSNGKILNTFNAPDGTNHLNDLAYDKNTDLLYASDEQDNQILKMTIDGTFSLYYAIKSSDNAYLNGLFVDGDKLIIQGEKGFLKSIDLNTKKVNNISSNMEKVRIDGIWKYNSKGYLVSKVGDKIYFVNNEGASKAFLIKNPTRVADISYSSELGLLLAPDFKSKIMAYEVKIVLKEPNKKLDKNESIKPQN